MKLDNRLQAIADFVENSNKILDVGTDHGYLCLYLVENKKAQLGIASDVSKLSLQKAIDLIKREAMEDKIECRLGSGLNVINKDDRVDTIVIAGMGGILISEILKEDIELIKETKPRFILQPVQRPEILREYLVENGYKILDETLVESDSKIYNIIVADYIGIKDKGYEDKYFEIGKYTDKNAVYNKQLEFLINKYETIVKSMKKAEEINIDEIKMREKYVEFLKGLKRNETKGN